MAAYREARPEQAFVTLATNDSYALGALTLAHSLRRHDTSRALVVMVTPLVSPNIRSALRSVFDDVTDVDVIDSGDATSLALMNRPDLGVTLTKLRCWLLERYEKCVFMDADTMVLQNIDDLFDREELSAAPDAGWPDCFNSGVFVYRPSRDTYRHLVEFALQHGSFDGGDQGLLNLFFKDWAIQEPSRRLPFLYNVVSQAFYTYLPAFNRFGKDIKVVHFIGALKPWHHTFDTQTHSVQMQSDPGHSAEHLQLWWNTFVKDVQPCLHCPEGHVSGSHLVTGGSFIGGEEVKEGAGAGTATGGLVDRQGSWEDGRADYLGVDAFSRIKEKIEDTIKKTGTTKP